MIADEVSECFGSASPDYRRYIFPVLHLVRYHELHQLLAEAGISFNMGSTSTNKFIGKFTSTTLRSFRIRSTKVEARGALVTYLVELGSLMLHVTLLNVEGKASRTRQTVRCHSKTGTSVQLGRWEDDEEYICKRFNFNNSFSILRAQEDGLEWVMKGRYSQIEDVILEYSIAKICSILRVGVRAGWPNHHFDLVCYDDCIEFAMERCEPFRS